MPYLYYYGVEIRPYSWGLFFAFGVALAFKETVSSESYRAYIKFAVFSALSGYAHHFALVASAFFWFFLFIYLLFSKSKKIRRFFIALLIFTVMYLPCFLLAIYQIRNASSYFSMSPLSLSSFLSDLRFPFVTHYTPLSMLLMIIFLFAFLVGLIYFIKGDYNLYSPLIYAALPVFVTVFGYAVSFSAGTSYFTSRYLIPSIGILWLGVAILLVRVLTSMPLIPMQILSVIFSIIILFSGFINYRSQFLSEYDNSVNEMTYWFDENLSADDGYIIYESAYQIEICMRYYYPNLKKYDYSNINEIKGNIWYFEVDGYENELEKASSLGYNIVYIKDMAFDRYNFKLYQLVKK